MDTQILYIGDPWLSTSSLSVLGVFTDPEAIKAYASDLLSKNIISEYGYKCLLGERGQCITMAEYQDEKLWLTSVPLNPTTSEF